MESNNIPQLGPELKPRTPVSHINASFQPILSMASHRTLNRDCSDRLVEQMATIYPFNFQSSICSLGSPDKPHQPYKNDDFVTKPPIVKPTNITSGAKAIKQKERTSARKVNKFDIDNSQIDQGNYSKQPRGKQINTKSKSNDHSVPQFDSEGEYTDYFEPLLCDRRSNLYLCDIKQIKTIRKNIPKRTNLTIKLGNFIRQRLKDLEEPKTYACKFCSEVFIELRSLGGHVSKNHPNRSFAYKRRVRVFEERKIERARKQFLNSIMS